LFDDYISFKSATNFFLGLNGVVSSEINLKVKEDPEKQPMGPASSEEPKSLKSPRINKSGFF